MAVVGDPPKWAVAKGRTVRAGPAHTCHPGNLVVRTFGVWGGLALAGSAVTCGTHQATNINCYVHSRSRIKADGAPSDGVLISTTLECWRIIKWMARHTFESGALPPAASILRRVDIYIADLLSNNKTNSFTRSLPRAPSFLTCLECVLQPPPVRAHIYTPDVRMHMQLCISPPTTVSHGIS